MREAQSARSDCVCFGRQVGHEFLPPPPHPLTFSCTSPVCINQYCRNFFSGAEKNNSTKVIVQTLALHTHTDKKILVKCLVERDVL